MCSGRPNVASIWRAGSNGLSPASPVNPGFPENSSTKVASCSRGSYQEASDSQWLALTLPGRPGFTPSALIWTRFPLASVSALACQ